MMLWPTLTCAPASGCGDCLLPPKPHYCCCVAGALKTHGRSEWESDRWRFKTKPRWIHRSSLWWRWWWGEVLQDPADQVSSVTSIIMRAVLWSGFGEASLLSVCGGFLQMGVRLLWGASLPGCSRFKTLTPSDSPHKRSPLTCHVEGSRWGSSRRQTLTSLALLPQRIWGGVRGGGDNMAVRTSPISHLWRAEVLWDGLNIDMLDFVKGLFSHGDEDMEQESFTALL